MAESIVLASLRYASVTVNHRTRWNFAEIGDDQGLTAVVETTSGGNVVSCLTPLMLAVAGLPIPGEADVVGIAGLTPRQLTRDFALATAVSALRTAIVDIQAQRDGLSLTQALGGRPVESVELYANTNRHLLTTERRPHDFAATAERAARDGFRTIKCTPFDEVDPGDPGANLLELARPGLDRLAAARSAIGPDITLLVDCHSRFDLKSAPIVAEELAQLDVGWFEEPVNPERDPEALAEIASRVSMPVAGGEHAYGAGFFERLVASRAVDVAMPDIKHCGGVREAVRAAALVARHGGQTSLHGPSGPVSILAGAHVTAAMPAALPLEFGAYECPWRAALIDPPEHVHNGCLHLPTGPGLGARLDPSLLRTHGHGWSPESL
ncbi:MAG: mandelate racemase/muconate lactonizing enzyme family protein [Chloroflexota bacterium]|nr:mandelate racemase/muconate lactonizing enzyme family protein [Chloroflexota bacterium]MDE2919499.1 mandelate racemase/muconate lactonizing enzyme family protein [Chloroflexota bacterium]